MRAPATMAIHRTKMTPGVVGFVMRSFGALSHADRQRLVHGAVVVLHVRQAFADSILKFGTKRLSRQLIADDTKVSPDTLVQLFRFSSSGIIATGYCYE